MLITGSGKKKAIVGKKLESKESYLPFGGTDTPILGLPQREPNERNDRNKERAGRISI